MIPHRQDIQAVGSGFCDDCECYMEELLPIGGHSLCLGCTIRVLVVRYLQGRTPPLDEGWHEGWHARSDMLRALIDAGWVSSYEELRPRLFALQEAGRIEQEWTSDETGIRSWYRVAGGGR